MPQAAPPSLPRRSRGGFPGPHALPSAPQAPTPLLGLAPGRRGRGGGIGGGAGDLSYRRGMSSALKGLPPSRGSPPAPELRHITLCPSLVRTLLQPHNPHDPYCLTLRPPGKGLEPRGKEGWLTPKTVPQRLPLGLPSPCPGTAPFWAFRAPGFHTSLFLPWPLTFPQALRCGAPEDLGRG